MSVFDNFFQSISVQLTVPFIISGDPTVRNVGNSALFTITFATIDSHSVTFDIVNTAIVEVIYWNAVQQDASNSSRNTTMFPADFPNVQSTQILVSGLKSDTKYNYRVRVLTSTASNAVDIPRAIGGTFTSSSEAGMYGQCA